MKFRKNPCHQYFVSFERERPYVILFKNREQKGTAYWKNGMIENKVWDFEMIKRYSKIEIRRWKAKQIVPNIP